MDIDDDDEVYFSNADDDPDFPVVQEYYINNIDIVDDSIVCPGCHTECFVLNAADVFVQHGICVIQHLSEQQQQPGQAIGQRRIIPVINLFNSIDGSFSGSTGHQFELRMSLCFFRREFYVSSVTR